MMSDKFYRAIQSQDNLDKVIPYRNYPLEGLVNPETIAIVTLRREGYTIQRIADTLGVSFSKAQRTVRRSPL